MESLINQGASSSEVTQNQSNVSNLTSQKTTSSVLNSTKLPTKEDAIVLDSLTGVSIDSYTVAIGQIIEPKNILHASWISQNRLYLFLKDESFVDKPLTENNRINVDSNILEVWRLVSRNTKIIISNAGPAIPNSFIEEELRKAGVHIASKITFIRGGNETPGYKHIRSLRWQVYVKSEDVFKVPASMKIECDDTSYWVYFSKDKVQCFLCKREGHIAKYCKTDTQEGDFDSKNSRSHEPGKDFPLLLLFKFNPVALVALYYPSKRQQQLYHAVVGSWQDEIPRIAELLFIYKNEIKS